MTKSDSKLTSFFECSLWFFFFYGFIHVTISVTQTIKDIYYYMAASALGCIALLVRRTLKMTWWIAVSIVLYVGYVVYFLYFHRNDWGYQYAI